MYYSLGDEIPNLKNWNEFLPYGMATTYDLGSCHPSHMSGLGNINLKSPWLLLMLGGLGAYLFLNKR